MKKILLTVCLTGSLVSAQATLFQYSVSLSGPNEFPANASPGIGSGTVNYDDAGHSLQIQFSFSGLNGTTAAAHIHAPTTAPGFQNAGVATTTPYFTGFPIGVSSGSYSNTLDLTSVSSWNPSFYGTNTLAFAESTLATAMSEGKSYLNIHSSTVPGGEIRGFLTPVPEPNTLAFAGLGAVGLALGAWKNRRARI